MKNGYFIFFVGVLFVSLMSFVYSEKCDTVGEIAGDFYCNEYGVYQNLKVGGETCLNNYECYASSCIDGVCASRYTSFEERTQLLEDIWNYFSGEECDPAYDTDYKCVGDVAYLCGQNYVWEEKGEVPGVCGVPGPIINDTDNDDSGSSGGSGGINIILFSPKNITYSSTLVPLRVADARGNAEYWKYSLNGDSELTFSPNITITASQGANTLIVRASRYSSFSSSVTKKVVFSVAAPLATHSCGDGRCDSDEDCSSCEADCGSCVIAVSGDYCGDKVCNLDESSATCPGDCPSVERKDRMWLFYILVGILGCGFLFVSFLLGRKLGWINWWRKEEPAINAYPVQNQQEFSTQQNS